MEFVTFRHGGHHVNDPGLYLPKEELERWKARDPLDLLRARMVDAGFDDAAIAAIDDRVEGLLEEAVEFATASPEPSVAEVLAEIEQPDEDEVSRGSARGAARGNAT